MKNPLFFWAGCAALVWFPLTGAAVTSTVDPLSEPLAKSLRGLPKPQVFAFLNRLNAKDRQMLQAAVFSTLYPSWRFLQGDGFRNTYYKLPLVIRGLGEGYQNVSMREWLESHPGNEFVSGRDYDEHNPDGTQPDGLVVRRERGRLVVERILESKMGPIEYQLSQTYGFVRIWQVLGIQLPDGTRFGPEQIDVVWEGKRHAVTNLDLHRPETLKQLEKATTRFVTLRAKGGFAGTLVQTPFSALELKTVGQQVLAYGWLGELSTPERVAQLLQKELPLPLPGYIPRKLLEPKDARGVRTPRRIPFPPRTPPQAGASKEEGDVHDFVDDNSLVNYMQDNLEFPKGVLGKYVSRLGGPMYVFAEMLDEGTREKLVRKGVLPNSWLMETWLMQVKMSQDEELAEEILRLYLCQYAKVDRAPFIEKLRKKKDPIWDAFLNANSVPQLFTQACPERIPRLVPSKR